MIPHFENFDPTLGAVFNNLARRAVKIGGGLVSLWAGAICYNGASADPHLALGAAMFIPFGAGFVLNGFLSKKPLDNISYTHTGTGIPYELGIGRNGHGQIGFYNLRPLLRNDRYPNPPSYFSPRPTHGDDSSWEKYPGAPEPR